MKKEAQYLDPCDWNTRPCWQVRNCPSESRNQCSVWQFEAGYYCWEINTNYCQGNLHLRLSEKKELCYQCEVYQGTLVKSEHAKEDKSS
jgi:hypothetical protein